ncbi:ribokinase [Priestia endophytica]|uniref:ribokinase n=1 Tax=Priestia endophytica TaxID=135735 RepID=UPI000F527BEB|nr:ribokinase [Priestia endophytica]MED4072902.1 ribokinase [Priestia endophytica]RPK01463.1 Ribokinase [Priestia endophytica]
MEAKNIVVIGSLNFDIIVKQQRLPDKGETFIADELIQGPGGKGANQAAQCAKLGLPTIMVGKVGDDRFGNALVGSLSAVGVNTSYIKRLGSTGMGIVHVMPDGDYYSTIVKGANDLITLQDIDEINDVLVSSSFIVLQQEIPEQVIEYIISKYEHTDTIIVLNNAPARIVKESILKAVDILVVNETEASFMVGKPMDSVDTAINIGKELLPLTGGMVVITLGKEGSVVVTSSHCEFVPAENVQAVDATGAGDSFIGALIYALSEGLSINQCMRFATHVSAVTVTKEGGQHSFPTQRDLESVLFKN